MLNADGSGLKPLTSYEYRENSLDYLIECGPDWASNKEIVFSSNISGRPEIYIININGKDLKSLTDINKGNFEPSWWPR